MNLLLVGIGGIFGATTRYKLGQFVTKHTSCRFPIGTFLLNITGAILLGVLTGIGAPTSVYHLLGDGFLGAYTTFSTFMYEGFRLFKEDETLNAISYITLSLVLGVVGYTLGFFITQAVM